MRSNVLPAALFLVSGAAAAAPPNPLSAGNLFQVVLGLCVVLALMAAAAWALKRFGAARMSAGAPVKIVGGIAVGTRERIMVVEVADQWIVVGVAPGRINTLSTMARQEIVTPPVGVSPANGFSGWLKQATDKRNAR
jgi:flagellar protein FliO/FliZ